MPPPPTDDLPCPRASWPCPGPHRLWPSPWPISEACGWVLGATLLPSFLSHIPSKQPESSCFLPHPCGICGDPLRAEMGQDAPIQVCLRYLFSQDPPNPETQVSPNTFNKPPSSRAHGPPGIFLSHFIWRTIEKGGLQLKKVLSVGVVQQVSIRVLSWRGGKVGEGTREG